ncbi:MAG: RluA family pseudouridine synthase [Candidatus Jorgensenbacteria bacterium]
MFEVIYEDRDFLVLNKPAGVLVHGVSGNPDADPDGTVGAGRSGLRSKHRREQGAKSSEETVVDWLLRYYPEVKGVGDPSTGSGQAPSAGSHLRPATDGQAGQAPSASSGQAPSTGSSTGAHSKSSGQVTPARPGIVHRLDRETSGVLVVARTQPFFEYLKRLFQTHAVVKTYLALVHGLVKARGVVDVPIGLRAGSVKRSVRARHMKMVKEAVTEYRPLKVFERDTSGGKPELFTLVELTPRTGRTHQLRVHLASIGHPVAGDALYGVKGNPLALSRHFLHAESIAFSLPDGKRMRFDAELPDDLKHIIDGLKEIR